MRLKLALAFAAGLVAAAPHQAHADAIPMPEQLSAEQLQLIGVWQEEKPLWPTGLGHSYLFRTIAFGNTDVTILTSSGIAAANIYATSGLRGDWTAKQQDDKTLVVTLTQSDARGTTLTLVFDGPDAFTLTDAEADRFGPSRFRRVTDPVKQIDPYR
jgi:hypothetical protein